MTYSNPEEEAQWFKTWADELCYEADAKFFADVPKTCNSTCPLYVPRAGAFPRCTLPPGHEGECAWEDHRWSAGFTFIIKPTRPIVRVDLQSVPR